MFPVKYNKEEYIKWHDEQWPADENLNEKVIAFRNDLKNNTKDDLSFLAELLEYQIAHCKNEYRIAKGIEFDYRIPLSEIISENEQAFAENKQTTATYDLLFKSGDSIINKLWRKNKLSENVNLNNIRTGMTDLVRTEIICSTLSACNFIATRLNSSNIHLPSDYYLKTQLDNKVDKIIFEPEMKMASGYFAYHGLIYFKTGLVLELQIYSSLMSNWRKLSHKLYEKARVESPVQYDYGTSEARLISLGHLLHLAECEVQRLEEDFRDR